MVKKRVGGALSTVDGTWFWDAELHAMRCASELDSGGSAPPDDLKMGLGARPTTDMDDDDTYSSQMSAVDEGSSPEEQDLADAAAEFEELMNQVKQSTQIRLRAMARIVGVFRKRMSARENAALALTEDQSLTDSVELTLARALTIAVVPPHGQACAHAWMHCSAIHQKSSIQVIPARVAWAAYALMPTLA
eukprot:4867968-Pleurochrysis_carterae.AAC.1